MKRLDRLSFLLGFHDRSESFSLSITQLSVNGCSLPQPLDPASFPFLRRLFFGALPNHSIQSILPLLPQIIYLEMKSSSSSEDIDLILPLSTSLTSISLSYLNFHQLDDGNHDIIKERLESIRVVLGGYTAPMSKLTECIASSKVLKKVILSGLMSTIPSSGQASRITELKKVVEACKKKKSVELWKENFIVNGKVDLNADVVGSLISFDTWTTTYSSYRPVRQPHLNWYESVRP
jgi:hypothetical protein